VNVSGSVESSVAGVGQIRLELSPTRKGQQRTSRNGGKTHAVQQVRVIEKRGRRGGCRGEKRWYGTEAGIGRGEAEREEGKGKERTSVDSEGRSIADTRAKVTDVFIAVATQKKRVSSRRSRLASPLEWKKRAGEERKKVTTYMTGPSKSTLP
jgi:hypothetical protein